MSDLMNEQKKAIIWRLWKKGSPMINIARMINKAPATIFSYLRYHGGIEPYIKRRAARSLTLGEREEISRGIVGNRSAREIANQLGRSHSTISREITNNGGRLKYRATIADSQAWKRAKRPKPYLLAEKLALKETVTVKLSKNWSPEQISGWLKLTYPDNDSMHVSHETIYKSLFIQTRGLFKKKMRNHLRTKRKFRHSKHHKVGTRGRIVDGASIRERPSFIEERSVAGHWEGDLIVGSQNSYIATVVERQSRFTVLVKVDGKSTESVVSNLSEQMSYLPNFLKQSLTWDRGTELSSHKNFSLATGMNVYFCDPSSPWQRGTNENTNGLLRQYFPKRSCLSGYSQDELNEIASELNNRPRKTLKFLTPVEKLERVLQ